MKTTLYLLMACLFSACSTIEYVGIETYNPAEITFPKNVGKVLIVNNAVTQPDDVGYAYYLYGNAQDTARAHADSALYKACHSLGKSIVDVSFFNDVLLYQGGTRQDTKYLVDEKLTPEVVNELCRETETDAIISFDRLLFQMEKNVVALSESFVAGRIDVDITGVVRSYLPGRDKPLATVYVQDSVFWSENADNIEQLKRYLPSPDKALQAAGQYIGTKVTPNFVPHWDNENRWLYKGEGARWKEATAYALADKWDEAASRWKYVYENSSRWAERAKAASNLALYNEMKTQLQEAYNLAAKSYELFNNKKGEEYNYTKMQRLYMEALGNRIRSDQKLNKQFGE